MHASWYFEKDTRLRIYYFILIECNLFYGIVSSFYYYFKIYLLILIFYFRPIIFFPVAPTATASSTLPPVSTSGAGCVASGRCLRRPTCPRHRILTLSPSSSPSPDHLFIPCRCLINSPSRRLPGVSRASSPPEKPRLPSLVVVGTCPMGISVRGRPKDAIFSRARRLFPLHRDFVRPPPATRRRRLPVISLPRWARRSLSRPRSSSSTHPGILLFPSQGRFSSRCG